MLASRAQLRRRCRCTGSKGRISTLTWVQVTPTGALQSTLGVTRFRQAAQASEIQTTAHGGSVQATMASRTDHRRFAGEAQKTEGTSTHRWVPWLGQDDGKVGPCPLLKTTAALGSDRRNCGHLAHSRARSHRRYTHALRMLCTCARTAWSRHGRGGHDTHGGVTTTAVRTARTSALHYAASTDKGGRPSSPRGSWRRRRARRRERRRGSRRRGRR